MFYSNLKRADTFLSLFQSYFLRQGISLNLDFTEWVDQLASRPQDTPIFTAPGLELKGRVIMSSIS